jgi:hypothetical protein
MFVMRFRLSPELLAVLEATCTTSAELDAFYIYGSIGIDVYLRRDGVVLIGEYDFMHDDAASQPSAAPTLQAIGMLVTAGERTPALLELLPKRGDSTPDCELCRGTGWLTLLERSGPISVVRRWFRVARRALGLGEGRIIRLTGEMFPVDGSPGETPPPRFELEFGPWRPGKKKGRVCFACHGLGWHAMLR